MKGEKLYLIRERDSEGYREANGGFSSYKQVNSCASYSSNLGTGLHTKLPHYISLEGNCEDEVISSEDPRFKGILLEEAGRLEKAIIECQNDIKNKQKFMDLIDEAYFETEESRYIIRHKENSSLYLKRGTLHSYSSNVAEGIHDSLPKVVIEEGSYNKRWISSKEGEFKEILKEAYLGNSFQMGFQKIKENSQYHLGIYSKNLSIIYDALNGKSIQRYIDEDKETRDRALELIRNYSE